MSDKVAKILEKLEQAAENEKGRLEIKERRMREFADIAMNDKVYYVANEARFYLKKRGEWDSIPDAGIKALYGLHGDADLNNFKEALRQQQRVRIKAGYSFYKKDNDYLNLMDRSKWLEPKVGEIDEVFNVLMTSISGGRSEARDHIEQCVLRKWRYPEDYQIPCIVIFGEGGAGKNTFVAGVLGTLFGEEQIRVLTTKQIFGDKNGRLKGSTIILVDDAVENKVAVDTMNALVHNKTWEIDAKYGQQEEIDSTAMWFMAGNEKTGPLLVSGSGTDRRWSLIHIPPKMNLMYWIKIMIKGIDSDEAARQWWEDARHSLTDAEQVSRWLYSLVEKWGDVSYTPSAYHGPEYEILADAHEEAVDMVYRYVFIDDDEFTHIKGSTLYALYTSLTNKGALPLGKKKFFAQIRLLLQAAQMPIKWEAMDVVAPNGKIKPSRAWFFYHPDRIRNSTSVRDNDIAYGTWEETPLGVKFKPRHDEFMRSQNRIRLVFDENSP